VKPSTDLERAIVQCLSNAMDYDIDREAVDCAASFFDPTGYHLGDYILDSLDIVEMLITLEADVGVAIITQSDATRFSSISRLGELIASTADSERRAAFETRWTRAG
jgi:acyl carrier protein